MLMKSIKYLENLQKLTNTNDTEIAKILNLSHGAISHYKSGRRIMDDETCMAIAIALNVHPMDVVGAACIDRAEKAGKNSLWETFTMRATALTASVVLVLVTNVLTPTNAEAAPLLAHSQIATTDTLYIMSN
jgi:hypothetical protein